MCRNADQLICSISNKAFVAQDIFVKVNFFWRARSLIQGRLLETPPDQVSRLNKSLQLIRSSRNQPCIFRRDTLSRHKSAVGERRPFFFPKKSLGKLAEAWQSFLRLTFGRWLMVLTLDTEVLCLFVFTLFHRTGFI